MSKQISAVIIGTICAMVAIGIVEAGIGTIFPPPPNFNFKDPEQLKHLMDQMPIAAFPALLFGYSLGSFVGGLVATIISGRTLSRPALIVGTIAMVGGIMNRLSIPHPLWFAITSTLLYIPLAYVGYLVSKKKNTETV